MANGKVTLNLSPGTMLGLTNILDTCLRSLPSLATPGDMKDGPESLHQDLRLVIPRTHGQQHTKIKKYPQRRQ